MISLSNGGSNIYRSDARSSELTVGTVDGVSLLRRSTAGWDQPVKRLAGCFVSAVASFEDGTLFAATHGSGVARSRDGGTTWEWPNRGLGHLDLWSIRVGRLKGKEVVIAGSQPAHLYISENQGDNWRELTALRESPSVETWCFPPPPRIGHVKDIVIDGDTLYVGIEIGALLVSNDAGESFRELPIHPDPRECDVHRILVNPLRPSQITVANGLVGILRSADFGETWMRQSLPALSNYPDAIVHHPDNPDLMFVSAGVGWPPHWYKTGRARGKIARSTDGGATWQRLLGGLPDGQRALFSALTIEAWGDDYVLYAADTDGQVFESIDGGDHWTIIADVAPVSKGEFYRGLVRDRVPLATVDDVIVNEAASARFAEAKI